MTFRTRSLVIKIYITPNMFFCLFFFSLSLIEIRKENPRVEWQAVVARQSGSHRKFIFSQMVAAFSMLSSWLGVSRKAPLVRKSFSLISESLSPWSCQSAEPRRPSWFRRNIELLFDVDMSLSHCALPPCSGCDIFYSVASQPRIQGDLTVCRSCEGTALYVYLRTYNALREIDHSGRTSRGTRPDVVLHCSRPRSSTVLLYAPAMDGRAKSTTTIDANGRLHGKKCPWAQFDAVS